MMKVKWKSDFLSCLVFTIAPFLVSLEDKVAEVVSPPVLNSEDLSVRVCFCVLSLLWHDFCSSAEGGLQEIPLFPPFGFACFRLAPLKVHEPSVSWQLPQHSEQHPQQLARWLFRAGLDHVLDGKAIFFFLLLL